MNGIMWLASYPKSGNTWLRVFFTNLHRNDATPVNINDINDLYPSQIAADRYLFDQCVGYKSSDLTHEEIDLLRPRVYRHRSAHGEELLFSKVHDAYTILPNGEPMFPLDVTAEVIYLIRNPLDVCVSFANHKGEKNLDKVIAQMAHPDYALAGNRCCLADQLRQRLLSWSDHVLSWVDATGLRILVLRYEDMKKNPVEEFTKAATFAGLPADPERVARAVTFSSIEELQQQEKAHGFVEGGGPKRAFFRKGKVGSWREALTSDQAARITEDHRDVMLRFGYLTEAGEPVY